MARTKRYATPHCRWLEKMGLDEDYWETACGESFIFIDAGPAENKMRFCCYCGRPIKVQARKGVARDE